MRADLLVFEWRVAHCNSASPTLGQKDNAAVFTLCPTSGGPTWAIYMPRGLPPRPQTEGEHHAMWYVAGSNHEVGALNCGALGACMARRVWASERPLRRIPHAAVRRPETHGFAAFPVARALCRGRPTVPPSHRRPDRLPDPARRPPGPTARPPPSVGASDGSTVEASRSIGARPTLRDRPRGLLPRAGGRRSAPRGRHTARWEGNARAAAATPGAGRASALRCHRSSPCTPHARSPPLHLPPRTKRQGLTSSLLGVFERHSVARHPEYGLNTFCVPTDALAAPKRRPSSDLAATRRRPHRERCRVGMTTTTERVVQVVQECQPTSGSESMPRILGRCLRSAFQLEDSLPVHMR